MIKTSKHNTNISKINNKESLRKQTNEENQEFVLDKINYIVLGIGFLVIVIGYFLLSGGKSPDRTIYNPEIYSTVRITIAPIVILLGFFVEIFALMWKFNKKSLIKQEESEAKA